MKKAVVFSIMILTILLAGAQEKEMVTKTGWNFGALPTITFDTDLGFQYGALVNLYNYGDGSRFPSYNHSLYFEVSRFTKGSGINRFYYDSDRLIKGLQTSVDMSYLSDQAYDFYGFNGYDAFYNADWIDDEQPAHIYKTRMFYKYDRKLFRFKVDLQGKLAGDHLRWITGWNFQNFKIADVNLEKLNKNKEGNDRLPEVPGLFQHYKDWGIISGDEVDGGFVPTFKGGVVFDSRDNRPNPMKGVWTEAVVEASPEILGAESSFAKLALIHRQYFTLVPRNLSLVYRLAYQTTLAGDVPFYYQSQVITSILTGPSRKDWAEARPFAGYSVTAWWVTASFTGMWKPAGNSSALTSSRTTSTLVSTLLPTSEGSPKRSTLQCLQISVHLKKLIFSSPRLRNCILPWVPDYALL